jgi:hypothetical protein
MKLAMSRRYVICGILAGALAYGLVDLGCNGNTTPPGTPFPRADAGAIGMSPGQGDGGQTFGDGSMPDGFTPPPQDGSTMSFDGGF